MFCPARSLVTNWLILARKWQQKQLIYTRRYTHSKDIDNRMSCIWWRGSWLQAYIILGWNDWKFEFCLKINQPKQFQALGPPLRPPLPPKGEPIAAPVPPPRRNKHSSGRSSSSRFTPSPLSSQVSSKKHTYYFSEARCLISNYFSTFLFFRCKKQIRCNFPVK